MHRSKAICMTGQGSPALVELGPGVEQRCLVALAVVACDKPRPYVLRLRRVEEKID